MTDSRTQAHEPSSGCSSRPTAIFLAIVVAGGSLLVGSAGATQEVRASSIRTHLASAGSSARPSPLCSRYASVSGKDDAPGSRARPYRTIARIFSKLSPGQAGCLLGGTFVEDVTIRRGGLAGQPIVLRSAPGSTATIRGRLWIADSADYVTVEFLRLDGRNAAHLPSPTVNGDWATFRNDDVTNYRSGAGAETGNGICFSVGFPGYGASLHTRIERSRIYDCGVTDNHNHGIYLALARYTVITDNYIYDNGDRGIQFYPDADDTKVERNVIDGNGEGIIFSGDSAGVSERNTVRQNIISNSHTRWNVESWYPDGVAAGAGNSVLHNCLWATNGDRYYNRGGGVDEPESGFRSLENTVADPLFIDRAGHDFRVGPSSRCRGYGPRSTIEVGAAPTSAPARGR
jgi:parallel beta-helix repeat protein